MQNTQINTEHKQKSPVVLLNRKRILFYCGGGYLFAEYFRPIVEEMIDDYDIEFLQGDYYLNAATKLQLEAMSRKRANFNFRIVPVLHLIDSKSLSYHKTINQVIDSLRINNFDLLVTGSDSSIGDRYLIKLARSKRARVVIVHTGIMSPRLISIYRKKIGINDKKDKFKANYFLKTKTKLFPRLLQKIKALANRLFLRRWKVFQNNYLMPLIFSKTVFPVSGYDGYGFTCGRGDAVICYDPVDLELLKQGVGTVKNIYLAKHPSTYYSLDQKDGTRKLSVLLAGHSVELSDSQIGFWARTIKEISEKKKLDEIHLRFHPRTDKKLTWPKKLLDLISGFGLEIVIVDTDKVLLPESLANCIGVVGTVSGALRTARAVCRGFVLGLKDASGEPTDRTWMLGSNEGINWISDGDDVREEYLAGPVAIDKDRLRVSQTLRELLNS